MNNQHESEIDEFSPKRRPSVDPRRSAKSTDRDQSRFNFTKRSLDALPLPRTGREYYNDEKQRGLQLKVFATGRKRFCLYRRLDGTPQRVDIGLYPDLSIDQARTEAQRLLGEIALGANPAKERRAVRDEMTWSELFAKYIELMKRRKKRTWKSEENQNRLYLGKLARRKLSDITSADIKAIHREVTEYAPYAANRAHSLVRGVFNVAINEWDWTGKNPAVGIKRNSEEKRDRFLDQDELLRLRDALVAETSELIRDYIITCLFTGARRSNVAAMRWDEIRWSRAVWEIPAEKSKKKKPMTVPLVPLVLAILNKRRAEVGDSEWVFPGRKGQTTKGHLVGATVAWYRVRRRTRLGDVRLHDLRRTHGSWQAILGSSLPIIGASLGHSDPQATQVYARLSLDPVRVSVERAGDAMSKFGKFDTLFPALPEKPDEK